MSRTVIFFGTPGSGYEELSRLLHDNSNALEKAAWKYFAEDYSWSSYYPRVPSSARMFDILGDAARGKRHALKDMFGYLKKLNAVLEQGSDIILGGGFPDILALRKFLDTGKVFPGISSTAIEVRVLVGRPGRILDSLYRQLAFRDIPDPRQNIRRADDYYGFLNPDKVLAEFSGMDNAEAWKHLGDDPAALDEEQKNRLYELLRIDPVVRDAGELMPKSIAGFTIAYALRTMQTHTDKWPEDIFPKIRKLEKNSGFHGSRYAGLLAPNLR